MLKSKVENLKVRWRCFATNCRIMRSRTLRKAKKITAKRSHAKMVDSLSILENIITIGSVTHIIYYNFLFESD